MKTYHFKSCMIGASIPLEKPAAFFRIQRSNKWREYLVLEERHLISVLKQQCEGMQVYLFEYGCITFVNFEEADISVFLEFLAGMVDAIDYAMVARYSESHLIEVGEDGSFRPWKESRRTCAFGPYVIPIIAILLSKSSALNKIEVDVDANLDDSGQYIEYLRRGKLQFNKKALSVVISNFLKFEYASIRTLRIYDRSVMDNDSIDSRELYDAFADYYELNDRFDVLQSKIGSLRGTMKSYNSLSYRRNENRLYWFEVFLLVMFPIAGLIRLILH
ncbi:RMD1 family protein [Gorillibacterium massiliense]|uniref:RMD1 family protein n=1 Tax=Gorillibacterium massiliense TaxID=1280390 RepID=UPI0004BC0758|nr:RMD1 family protein [Gorillibacterium massiliense]